jgi:hypothetical protein
MRRVHILNGLKQRMHEVLGTDTPTTDTLDPESVIKTLTPWSIQAAMIANLERLVRAITGHANNGRVMNGHWMTYESSTVTISKGISFTRNGQMIETTKEISESITDNMYFYLRHKVAFVEQSESTSGKKTSFIGKDSQREMVVDDFAAAKGDDIDSHQDEILVVSATEINDDDDLVLIGRAYYNTGEVSSVEPNTTRGVGNNNPDGNMLVNKILAMTRIETEDLRIATLGTNNSVNPIDVIAGLDFSNLASGHQLNLPSGTGDLEVGGVPAENYTNKDLDGQKITVVNGIITDISAV